MNDASSTSVVERILDLIGCLSSAPKTVREICEHTGIPVSTAHRLLRPLVERKFVIRQRRGLYALGIASVEIAVRADIDSIITTATRPIMADLAKTCRRTVHLGVFRDNLVRYLVKAESGCRRSPSREEIELEAYCTAIGKALLAQLERDRLEDYLALGDFVPLTDNTIFDVDDLRQEINGVRRQGWAIDRGEMYPELRCLAVPIRGRTGLLAAVSVTEVCNDVDPEKAEQDLLTLFPRIVEAAEAVSDVLRMPGGEVREKRSNKT